MLAKAGQNADPVQHLLDELYRSAALVHVWGSLVDQLDEVEQGIDRTETYDATRVSRDGQVVEYEAARSLDGRGLLGRDREGMVNLHPYVVEFGRERERHAKLAKLCIDAGIAERQVRVAEQHAEMFARVISAALADPQLQLDPAAQQRARGVFARHLTAAVKAPA